MRLTGDYKLEQFNLDTSYSIRRDRDEWRLAEAETQLLSESKFTEG